MTALGSGNHCRGSTEVAHRRAAFRAEPGDEWAPLSRGAGSQEVPNPERSGGSPLYGPDSVTAYPARPRPNIFFGVRAPAPPAPGPRPAGGHAGARVRAGPVTPLVHDAVVDGRIDAPNRASPNRGVRAMPLTVCPHRRPVPAPGLKSHRPPAPPRRSPSTAPTARTAGPRCATTAWSPSSSAASPRMPWWWTPTRPGPSACSSRPVWSPASATPGRWADTPAWTVGRVRRPARASVAARRWCVSRSAVSEPRRPVGRPGRPAWADRPGRPRTPVPVCARWASPPPTCSKRPARTWSSGSARARRRHAVHLPEPRAVHRSRPDPSRGRALVVGAWSYRHEEPPVR